MRFAYADPPYFGQCKRYNHHHPDGKCWDQIQTHAALIDRLVSEWDGWALSLSSTNLRDILPLCPTTVRVAAWVKPFASFKKNVSPAYCWEPVIFSGWRGRTSHDLPAKGGGRVTPRDYHSAVITFKKGLCGAKPETVCEWILSLLGVLPTDTMDDLYPGTGIMTRTFAQLKGATPK